MAGVVVNVTASGSRVAGTVTVWPCGTPRPGLANLSFAARATVSNRAFSGVGTGAQENRLCVLSTTAVHLSVDGVGWAPAGAGFTAMPAARVFSSQSGRQLAAGSTTAVSMVPSVPAGTAAVAVNVTVVTPLRAGWISVVPCGSNARPRTLSYRARQTASVGVLTNLGTASSICIYTSAATHLLVDSNGHSTQPL